MIRFTVETHTSNRDTSGNCYHFATITSTKTGKALKITHCGGERNPEYHLKRLTGADWSEIKSFQSNHPIREWNRMDKFHKNGAKYEHQLTAEDFAALEVE